MIVQLPFGRYGSFGVDASQVGADVGAAAGGVARNLGLPDFLQKIVSGQGAQTVNPQTRLPVSDGIFGIPKTIMLVGGGILLLGLGTFLFVRWRRKKLRR